jgi:hypothetical protein
MPAATLRYRVSPKILGAAQSLACRNRKHWIYRTSSLFFIAAAVLAGSAASWFGAAAVGKGVSWGDMAFCAILCLCFLSFLLYPYCVLVARFGLRQLNEEQGEYALTIEEDGLLCINARMRTCFYWSHIHEIREIPAKTGGWLAILLDSPAQGMTLPIPLTAFADDHEKQAFIAEIEAKMAASAQTPAE